MKKALLLRAFGASFAIATLAVSGLYYANAASVLPRPSVSGPTLGDPTTNLDSIEQSLQNNTFANYWSLTTFTVAAGQTTSTLLQPGFTLLTAAVAVTGTLSLPTAKPGANVVIANNTGVNVMLFENGSNPFTVGGIDYINNKPGTAAGAAVSFGYVLTNGYATDCFVPQGGNWWCQGGY